MFSVRDKNPGPVCPARNAYRTIWGSGTVGGVRTPGLRGRQSDENFNYTGSPHAPKADQIPARRGPRGPVGLSAGGRRVACTCDGGAAPGCPHRPAGGVRDITGYAPRPASMRAVFPFPGRESLSGAERNLRVRSVKRDRDARASRLRCNLTPATVQPSNQGCPPGLKARQMGNANAGRGRGLVSVAPGMTANDFTS